MSHLPSWCQTQPLRWPQRTNSGWQPGSSLWNFGTTWNSCSQHKEREEEKKTCQLQLKWKQRKRYRDSHTTPMQSKPSNRTQLNQWWTTNRPKRKKKPELVLKRERPYMEIWREGFLLQMCSWFTLHGNMKRRVSATNVVLFYMATWRGFLLQMW